MTINEHYQENSEKLEFNSEHQITYPTAWKDVV